MKCHFAKNSIARREIDFQGFSFLINTNVEENIK